MTDYKQLCVEFVGAVDRLLSQGESPANPGQRLNLTVHVEDLDAIADRARAALAEPESKGLTDEELLEINHGAYCPSTDEVNDEDDSSWQYTSDYIRWLDENGTPEEQEACAAKGLRAVFKAGSRWGRPAPAPQPIPVAERLPGDQLCWWFEDGEECGYGSSWTLLRIRGCTTAFAHWLPANALPLPQ